MPTCPLCENVQPGGEACEVCGRPFARGEGTPEPVAPVEGLEPTLLPDVETPVERLPDLEPNLFGPVDAAPPPVEDLEPTHAPPVEVVPDATPDLLVNEADGVADAAAPLVARPLACRYCGTPAAGELFCARCGMRLAVGATALAEGAAAGGAAADGAGGVAAGGEGEPVPCRNCSVPVRGNACPACGARVHP